MLIEASRHVFVLYWRRYPKVYGMHVMFSYKYPITNLKNTPILPWGGANLLLYTTSHNDTFATWARFEGEGRATQIKYKI